MFKYLSLLMLLQGARAMDIEIGEISCLEGAITPTFETIGNNSYFTLGEETDIVGKLAYYGMIDMYGLNAESELYFDLNMTLYAIESGKAIIDLLEEKPIFQHNLLDFESMDICDERLTPQNQYGCPYGGDYTFDTNITLPAMENFFKDWLYTGYTGLATIAVYSGRNYASPLLGECTFEFETFVGESMGVLANAPDGRTTLIAVASAASVMVLLGLLCACCACRRRGGKSLSVKKLGESARSALFGDSKDFKLMEDAALENPSAWDSSAVTGTHPSQKDMLVV